MKTLSIFAPGVVTLMGDIVDRNENMVTIRHKKPRSSKFLVSTLAMKDVVFLSESEDELSSEVSFFSNRALFAEVQVTDISMNDSGMFTGTDADGNAVTFTANDVEIVGDDEEEAPKAKGKKKPESKGKGKKKPEPEEDEDEDDEDFDRDAVIKELLKQKLVTKAKAKKMSDEELQELLDAEDEEDDEEEEPAPKGKKGKGKKKPEPEEEDEDEDDDEDWD